MRNVWYYINVHPLKCVPCCWYDSIQYLQFNVIIMTDAFWQCSCELKPLATGPGLVSMPWESDRLDPAPPRELINRWQKALTPGAAGLPAQCPPCSSASLQSCRLSALFVQRCSAYNRDLLIRFTVQTRIFLCLLLAVFGFTILFNRRWFYSTPRLNGFLFSHCW